MSAHAIKRMRSTGNDTNPVEGTVSWNPVKSLWYSSHCLVALVGAALWFEWKAVFVCGALTVVTLCCGHTVGLHRMLIHRSLKCPLWLERFLIYLGTLVGMGGPFNMIYLHDIRDWAQRHTCCHGFFIHSSGIIRDWWWNLHCRIRLAHPPEFTIEPERLNDPFLRFMQQTWMLQQLPLAAVLYWIGGWSFVAMGISGRIALSLTGHWLIGFFAHNHGVRRWHITGHAAQGYNLPGLGLLTMGESWHNNHHAYPDSARLGHHHQADPGWWFVKVLGMLGLASEVSVPETLPPRPERVLL
ncbi:MAG: acyl-CoA desaturase [Verrucomicrobiales bacterium]|nr:acyl-CoA desaturase [Verrucomicrobiales bacterium]